MQKTEENRREISRNPKQEFRFDPARKRKDNKGEKNTKRRLPGPAMQ